MSKDIKTELSLAKVDEDIISDIQKELMEEELVELDSIKENHVNIFTVYVFDNGEELEVKIYFRNGLDRKINFEFLPLILVNSKNEEIGRDTFYLKGMGDIPSGGARPWKIHFNKKSVDMAKFKDEQCKVIFDSMIKSVNYADIEFECIPEVFLKYEQIFKKFLCDLPKIEKGQLSISIFDIILNIDGKIIITLIIRNSTDEYVKLQEIPMTIKDKNNKIITSNKFSLDNFTLKPMKARICNLAISTDIKTESSVSVKNKWNVIFQ